MSQTITPDRLLEERGDTRSLEAFVVGAAYDRSGACAFALGDGTVWVTRKAGEWLRVEAHDGAALVLAADCRPAGWVTGGDDGRFVRVSADGTASALAEFGMMKWVEHVASTTDGKVRCLGTAAAR